jgi:hypothetical protein
MRSNVLAGFAENSSRVESGENVLDVQNKDWAIFMAVTLLLLAQ